MTGLRTFGEVAIGAIHIAGATFNAVWTLRHSEEFYGDFVAHSWVPLG